MGQEQGRYLPLPMDDEEAIVAASHFQEGSLQEAPFAHLPPDLIGLLAQHLDLEDLGTPPTS